jgi:two-component system nitrate/nitrite response regulator NarL
VIAGPSPPANAPHAVPSDILRILVADDQEAIRKRVRSILVSTSGFEGCAEAANGREAVEKAHEFKPDLIILDITMPVSNGLDAARMIRRVSPETPILILSVHKSRQLMDEAQKIGVQGYATKADASQDLITAVDAVLRKMTFFPQEF